MSDERSRLDLDVAPLAGEAAEIGPDVSARRVEAGPMPRSWTRGAAAILVAGGLLTGGLAGTALSTLASPQTSEISPIALADLDTAALAIPSTEAGTYVADAKACRVPLAYVTLRARPGSKGIVRIGSGAYSTGAIHLGAEPLRVPLPFPAPYAEGRGDFVFQSDGVAFDVFLRPGWFDSGASASAVAHVWWTPKAPC